MSWGEILGAVAGPVLQMFGQQTANQTNRDIANSTNITSLHDSALNREFQQASADKQMAFQADQSRQQMAFQEQMSSTARQREVADLKKAGLNPILAAMGSGASTPSGAAGGGAAASGSQASLQSAKMENIMEGFSGTAREVMNIKKSKAEIGMIGTQEGVMESQRRLNEAQRRKSDTERKVIEGQVPGSEMKKEMYDSVKPYLDKLLDAIKTNPKSLLRQRRY